MTDLRIYSPDDLGPDGYPSAWHHDHWHDDKRYPPIKDAIRATMNHRCERCKHPYTKGDPRISTAGQWSPCTENCTHEGPVRSFAPDGVPSYTHESTGIVPAIRAGYRIEAQWRILTVHHLNGVKWDCRWWNLAALCQRCHLSIQGRVIMERVYPYEHSEWFKLHAAGWYAWDYLGEELTIAETIERMEELLSLERMV